MRAVVDKPDLVQLAKRAALDAGLDPALVCGLIEVESGWDRWKVAYNPARDPWRNTLLDCLPRDGAPLRFAWGLMQVSGVDARVVGYEGPVTQLCFPTLALFVGCSVLANYFRAAPAGYYEALRAWDKGATANYPTKVWEAREGYL